MPPRTRPLTRRRRSPRQSLHVESLERRQVLAGNVAAQLVGSTLVLTGDALGNALVVSSVTGGRMAVLGDGLTTVNGSTDPFVTAKRVVSIIANLNGGDDGIAFSNTAFGIRDQLLELGITPTFDAGDLQDDIDAVADGAERFVLPGSLAITMAGGSDLVSIIGAIGGSLAANLGSAPTGPETGNALMIGGFEPPYASSVGGGVSIVGGNQADFCELAGTTVGGGVAASLGNGDNGLALYESSIGSLAYTGGSGSDYVDTADLRVKYGASVLTGAGEDEVYMHEHEGGPQTIVGGSIAVNTGADADYVEISTAVRGALSVVTGTGDDEVRIYESSIGLNAVVDTGSGNDIASIALTQVRFSLLASMGAGDDDLEVTALRAFAASLYGGPGTNELGIDTASRNAIRRLFYTQFQAVTT